MKKSWGPSAQGPAASQTQEYHSPKGQGPGPSSGLNQSGPKLPLELQTKSHRQELLLCKLRSKSHFQFCLRDLGEGGIGILQGHVLGHVVLGREPRPLELKVCIQALWVTGLGLNPVLLLFFYLFFCWIPSSWPQP